MRFPSCSVCNRIKKDAESRAAVVANMFSRIDPPGAEELDRSVQRGLSFYERDAEFRATIAGHPTHMWDFARGSAPMNVTDPMSAMDTPHALPNSFSDALLELGRFFGQALYYWTSKKVMRADQKVSVQLATNAASPEYRVLMQAIGENLHQIVPEPADRNHIPLFGFGLALIPETEALYFTGERRGAFAWAGVAGQVDGDLLAAARGVTWFGDGRRCQ